MKKAFLSLGIVCMGLLVFSCGTTKKAMSPAELDGQWNIVEVNGKAIEKGEMPAPFIGFDFAQKRIFGNSGCNRMMGTFEADTLNPGKLSFGPIAGTRMACPDMTTEQSILEALSQVKSYESVACPKDPEAPCKIALCDQGGKKILELEKKAEEPAVTNVDALDGTWVIKTVNGTEVPQTERPAYLGFNIAEKRVYGNPGCNSIGGSLEADVNKPGELAFGQMISTLMACPNMETESAVLKALNEVKSFKITGEQLALYDASGTEVITLKKDLTLGE